MYNDIHPEMASQHLFMVADYLTDLDKELYELYNLITVSMLKPNINLKFLAEVKSLII